MARFNPNEVENYGGGGAGEFLKLVNNKDTAKVRFLYNTIDDVVCDSVHQVKIGDKRKWVSCLRSYRDPMDKCPLCKSGNKAEAKIFIPIYNIDADRVQIFERGKKFIPKLSGFISRYTKDTDFVQHIFEVERQGEAGDQQTVYELFEVGCDDTVLEDFEMPEIYGKHVLEKTADEMQYYLDNHSFSDSDSQPIRRRGSDREERQESTGRRTPARNNSETF